MNQLIRCINCDDLFLRTPFDQFPEYEACTDPSSGIFQALDRDDFQDFLRSHHGHQLEYLKVIGDSFISEKAYFEPVKTSYFRVTNGKERFVVKRFRERIEEPLKYQLIYGDYSLKCTRIEIQAEAIARQLEAEFKTSPLTQAEISDFLDLYRHIAKTVDIDNLERIPEESPHPLEVYHKLDDVSLVFLLRNCRNIFKGQKYPAIDDFINREKEDGVLLLKATYKVQLREMAPLKKRIPAPPVRLEKKELAEKE
jgi:DNA-binding transcriptional regulator/RsmH inhibitor MraZ